MAAIATAVRRQIVTVLFVDIVGYTALVDDLDCAVVHRLQSDYFATVSALVGEYGGVVEKYVGDAVMAVFGAGPDTATTDDADDAATAAVRSGLAVQEALRGRLLAGRYPVRTRAGVATGEVMLDVTAARDGGHAMVSGSVVSTAARLQACAPHDTVVVCAATRTATDRSMAYQELPPVAVAGKPYPLEVSRALHPQRALVLHA